MDSPYIYARDSRSLTTMLPQVDLGGEPTVAPTPTLYFSLYLRTRGRLSSPYGAEVNSVQQAA